MRQPLQFDKGIGRFEEKATFATEGVQRYVDSSANGGRKSPLNLKKSVGFQPKYCLIVCFWLVLRLFYFWTISVLPNVAAPFLLLNHAKEEPGNIIVNLYVSEEITEAVGIEPTA